MVNPFTAIVGIIILIIVVGGLLYLFYSRTNGVEKSGYGALIMLALISAMIPIFWIMETNNEVNATSEQHALAVQRGIGLYAQYCVKCYTIKDGKLVNPTYNGYPISTLNQMNDDQLTRVISGGAYNPAVPTPTGANAIPTSQEYGGPLNTNDVEYLFAFIRSADPVYLRKHGYTGDSAKNGFDQLVAYLQTNLPAVYQTASAPPPSNPNQFGTATDMTSKTAVTINIVDAPAGATCTPACYDPINVKVKVGTVITWVNKSTTIHTVSAIVGTNTNAPKVAAQIFDSGVGKAIATGGTYTYTVTMGAYNFNPDHVVVYYCQFHPTGMFAELTIVP